MTREQLLNEFNRFDDDRLEKLLTIADGIISPLDTELTSTDYASMVNQVFKPNGLADMYFPQWTDRSKSDFGRFLVELFAVFSDKDFFYINHLFRESFVGVADMYRSIFHKALEQGFNPPSNTSSSGLVYMLFSSGDSVFMPRGSVVIGVQVMPDLVYINDEFTIPTSSISQNVSVIFRHGKLRREQQFFDGYSIVINTMSIVDNSVELFIGGIKWTQTNNFTQGNPATKHFMVFYDENARAEIMFAKGGLGLIPLEGEICDISYVIGGGYGADLVANTIDSVIDVQSSRSIISFNHQAMTGGNSLLPMEVLRQTVIGKARHQNRVVTIDDVAFFCGELSFIKKVYADVFLNYVYVYVLPIGGGDITPEQIDLVKAKISPKLLMGYFVVVNSPIYISVDISLEVYVSPSTNRATAETMTRQVVEELLNPMKLGNFGQGVNRSLLASKILQRIKGSQNVVFTKLERRGIATTDAPVSVNDLIFTGQELINYANPNTLTGSNISITIRGGDGE